MSCFAINEMVKQVFYAGSGCIVDVGSKFVQQSRKYNRMFGLQFTDFWPRPAEEDPTLGRWKAEKANWDELVREIGAMHIKL